MIRHKIFSGIEAYYTDPDTGYLVVNSHGEAATDRDMEQHFKTIEPDLDRMTLQMCADYRNRGEFLEQWLLDAELDAFLRIQRKIA